jgi:hypothetical protein
MIARLPLAALCAAFLVFSACDRGPQPTAEESAPTEVVPIAGLYQVSGSTVGPAPGRKRDISGTVVLAEKGDNYSASFHLSTIWEGEGGVLPAEVIGKGSGTIEGRMLRGSAETQLVISTVPGIDPGFAYIPRTTTTRLVSDSVTTLAADGSILVLIENTPASGETYVPTRTTLRGIRIGAAPTAGEGPSNAAAPAKKAVAED